MTAWKVLQAILIFLLPLIIIYLCKSIKLLKFIGPILLCYLLGLIIGNLPLNIDKNIASTISEITIVLAIPFILFNCDIMRWISTSKKTVLSFSLLTFSVVIAAIISAFLFRTKCEGFWNISGMLTGCYTGGTPNLVAIGMGLGVNKDLIAMVIAVDTVIGGIYYFLLLAFGIKLAGKFLKPFEITLHNRFSKLAVSEYDLSGHQQVSNTKEASFIRTPESIYESSVIMVEETDKILQNNSYTHKLMNNVKSNIVNIIRVCLLAILSVGASVGLAYVITGEMAVAFIMLGVTTMGIAFSFIKKVNSTPQSYKIGEYLIYIFSFSLALTVDVKNLINMPTIFFAYTSIVMIGAIVIHFILSALFKIDRDTAIVTSTAGIYGPAFIPPVVSALNNKEVLITGLSCGLIGYAIGNYIGFLTAGILKLLMN